MNCWLCHGSGRINIHNPATGLYDEERACPVCNGMGILPPGREYPRNWPYEQGELDLAVRDAPPPPWRFPKSPKS